MTQNTIVKVPLLVKPPNAAKLLDDGWEKCASVTFGGRPYFWHNPITRQWIVWDRDYQSWKLEGNF